MTSQQTDLQRIRDRYPTAPRRRRLLQLLALLLAVVLLGWMSWAGWKRSNPPVAADIQGFDIAGPHQANARVRVQRTDPAQPVVCTLKATAVDFVAVGESELQVPAGSQKITIVPTSLRTIREATTVVVEGCRTA